MPLDAIKSAEYDALDRTLSILSRDRNGVVYDRNGVAFVFLYRTAPGAESSRQAADSLRSCLAYAASFAGAEFQGAGVDSFSRWVATQVIYPPTLQRFNKSGLVRVAFTVRADGSVCDFRELESSSPLFHPGGDPGDAWVHPDGNPLLHSVNRWTPRIRLLWSSIPVHLPIITDMCWVTSGLEVCSVSSGDIDTSDCVFGA